MVISRCFYPSLTRLFLLSLGGRLLLDRIAYVHFVHDFSILFGFLWISKISYFDSDSFMVSDTWALQRRTDFKLKSDRMLESQQSADCYSDTVTGYHRPSRSLLFELSMSVVDQTWSAETGGRRPCWERGRAQPGNCGDRWPGDWWRWVMLSQIRTSRQALAGPASALLPHTLTCVLGVRRQQCLETTEILYQPWEGGGNNTKRWFTLTTLCEEVIHRQRLMVISSV